MLPVISHNYFDGLNYRWEVALCMLLSSWSLASNNKIKHKSQTDEQNNEKEMKCSTMKTSEFIEKLYTHDERQQSLGNSSKFWKSNPPRPFKLNLIHSKVRFFTIADTFCFFFLSGVCYLMLPLSIYQSIFSDSIPNLTSRKTVNWIKLDFVRILLQSHCVLPCSLDNWIFTFKHQIS